MLANMHSTTLLYCSTGIYFFIIFYSSSTIYLVFLILLLPFLFSSCSSFPSFSSSSPLPLFLHFLYHLCSYSFNLLFHPSHIMTKTISRVRDMWNFEFNASLFYRTNSSTATDKQRNPVLERDDCLDGRKNHCEQKALWLVKSWKVYICFIHEAWLSQNFTTNIQQNRFEHLT